MKISDAEGKGRTEFFCSRTRVGHQTLSFLHSSLVGAKALG
jgi:hypothetical protein